MRRSVAALATAGLLACVPHASGFGTIDLILPITFQDPVTHLSHTTRFVAQTAIHWKVTRAALECKTAPRWRVEDFSGRCFEPGSMERLSGEGMIARPGAVEAPDYDRFFEDTAHCTDGDFIANVPYPRVQGDAFKSLHTCRRYLLDRFEQAVKEADSLVDQDGQIAPKAVDIGSCVFVDRAVGLAGATRFGLHLATYIKGLSTVEKVTNAFSIAKATAMVGWFSQDVATVGGVPGPTAKCRVLLHLGAVLHGVQDSYAHGNWSDTKAPGRVSVANPPGLENSETNPFVRMVGGTDKPPAGWLTACYSLIGECRGRVDHADFAKDTGEVKLVSIGHHGGVPMGRLEIGEPKEARGNVALNFQSALHVAVKGSYEVWKDLGYALQKRYGQSRGLQMVCALSHDLPLADCGAPRVVADGGGYIDPAKGLASLCVTAWVSPGSVVTGTISPAGPGGADAAVAPVPAKLAELMPTGQTSADQLAPTYMWRGYWLSGVVNGPGTYEVTVTSKRYKNSAWEVTLVSKQKVVVPKPENPTGVQAWPPVTILASCRGPQP